LRARRDGIPWRDLAQKFESVYLEDMAALRNTELDLVKRATDHIDQIVSQIKVLLAKGAAYSTPDGIYFDLSSFANYGRLSGRTGTEDNDSVSRIDDSFEKKATGDFCLWKRSKAGEPTWDTAIGMGRPGWHVEDTAISETYLGSQYDIHGGAIDLIFPHHEAEIALMESVSGRSPFVRYWLHTGFLNINEEKMAKSKGNFVNIREALKRYDYRVLRFAFLSQHYRTTVNFGEELLEQAEAAIRRLQTFSASIRDVESKPEELRAAEETAKAIYAALDDDLNTPKAFAELFGYIRSRNSVGNATHASRRLIDDLQRIFKMFDFDSTNKSNLAPEIQKLIALRESLRRQRRYIEADEIRDQLLASGLQVADSAY
jgi:cysteinyl-tRNA synthetase